MESEPQVAVVFFEGGHKSRQKRSVDVEALGAMDRLIIHSSQHSSDSRNVHSITVYYVFILRFRSKYHLHKLGNSYEKYLLIHLNAKSLFEVLSSIH